MKLRPSRITTPLVLLTGIACTGMASAGTITALIAAPVIDQWVYPFNDDPGNKFFMSTFASQLPDGFSPLFDNRDGQPLVAFDVSGVLPEGTTSFTVESAIVTFRTATDGTFEYDPTSDSYTSWLQPDDPDYLADADPGRPVEIFGTGFRNGLNPQNYVESMPYSFSGPFGKEIRNAHPIAFDSPAAALDASNSVDLEFDPTPFAVGMIDGFAPGTTVPVNTDVVFDIDVSDPDVQSYVAGQVAGGRLFFQVASLFPASQQGQGTFPSFYTKENPLVVAGIQQATRLALTIVIDEPLLGDLDGDGMVNGADLGLLLAAWGTKDPGADLNGDGTVDGSDLGLLLGAWTG